MVVTPLSVNAVNGREAFFSCSRSVPTVGFFYLVRRSSPIPAGANRAKQINIMIVALISSLPFKKSFAIITASVLPQPAPMLLAQGPCGSSKAHYPSYHQGQISIIHDPNFPPLQCQGIINHSKKLEKAENVYPVRSPADRTNKALTTPDFKPVPIRRT